MRCAFKPLITKHPFLAASTFKCNTLQVKKKKRRWEANTGSLTELYEKPNLKKVFAQASHLPDSSSSPSIQGSKGRSFWLAVFWPSRGKLLLCGAGFCQYGLIWHSVTGSQTAGTASLKTETISQYTQLQWYCQLKKIHKESVSSGKIFEPLETKVCQRNFTLVPWGKG